MHGRRVVPQDTITRLPLMAANEFWPDDPIKQLIQKVAAFIFGQAIDEGHHGRIHLDALPVSDQVGTDHRLQDR